MNSHFELKIIEKLKILNNLDILNAKYKQASIEASIAKNLAKSEMMDSYSNILTEASKYIIVQYEKEQLSSTLRQDMVRTIAMQEYKIKELEQEVEKLKKVIAL